MASTVLPTSIDVAGMDVLEFNRQKSVGEVAFENEFMELFDEIPVDDVSSFTETPEDPYRDVGSDSSLSDCERGESASPNLTSHPGSRSVSISNPNPIPVVGSDCHEIDIVDFNFDGFEYKLDNFNLDDSSVEDIKNKRKETEPRMATRPKNKSIRKSKPRRKNQEDDDGDYDYEQEQEQEQRQRKQQQDDDCDYSDDMGCSKTRKKNNNNNNNNTTPNVNKKKETKKKQEPLSQQEIDEQVAHKALEKALKENAPPSKIKALRAEFKKARNRVLALESRIRKRNKMAHLEEENKKLKDRVAELEAEVRMLRSLNGNGNGNGNGNRASSSSSSSSSLATIHDNVSPQPSSSSDSCSVTTDDVPSSPDSMYESAPKRRKRSRRGTTSSMLMKGAMGIGLTTGMVMLSDSGTSGGFHGGTGDYYTQIGLWTVGWNLLQDSGLKLRSFLPHFIALLFGVIMTLCFVGMYYYRTLHHRQRRKHQQQALAEKSYSPRGNSSSNSNPAPFGNRRRPLHNLTPTLSL